MAGLLFHPSLFTKHRIGFVGILAIWSIAASLIGFFYNKNPASSVSFTGSIDNVNSDNGYSDNLNDSYRWYTGNNYTDKHSSSYEEISETLKTLIGVLRCMQTAQAKTQVSFGLELKLQLADGVEHCRRRTQNLLYFMYYDVGRQLLLLTSESFNASTRWTLLSSAQQDYDDYILDLSKELTVFRDAVLAMQLTLPVRPLRAVEYCLLQKYKKSASDNQISLTRLNETISLRNGSLLELEQAKLVLQNFTHQYSAMESMTSDWGTFLSLLTHRHSRIGNLSELLAKKINKTQYPEKCETQRTLVCQLYKVVGFTSEVRRLLYCFTLALGSGRILQIDSEGMLKGSASWSDMFLPASSCANYSNKEPIFGKSTENEPNVRVVYYDNNRPIYQPENRPRSIPSDISDITALHGDPFEWFSGQLTSFLFRLRPDVEQKLTAAIDALQLTYPTVGMHIRRTDKYTEVPLHAVKEYFDVAELYYRKLELQSYADGNVSNGKNATFARRVYIATDEPVVIKEAQEMYPNFKIIADITRSEQGSLNKRYSSDGFFNTLVDVYALARTDFVVCTMSSSFCALVYTMKQAALQDASNSVISLDCDLWSTKNFDQKDRKFKAVHAQRPNGDRKLMSVLPGDMINVVNRERFGLAKGYNTRTRESGRLQSAMDCLEHLTELKTMSPSYFSVTGRKAFTKYLTRVKLRCNDDDE